MAYTPTVWDTGDTVTADKLNNIENGIKALNTLVVKVIDGAMNRTFKQIFDAYKVGHPVIILDESANQYTSINVADGVTHVIVCSFGTFATDSDSGYPAISEPSYG